MTQQFENLVPYRFSDKPTPKNAKTRRGLRLIIKGNPIPSDKQLAKYRELLMQGDDLADAMVDMYRRLPSGQGRKLFEQALEHGIESVESPPDELLAFFKQLDSIPVWYDEKMMNVGGRMQRRAGSTSEYFLRDVILMAGYQASATSKALVFTGSLGNKVTSVRRIVETGHFFMDVIQENAMRRFGEGFKTAVRVRMMHALSRRKVAESPNWQHEEWGAPINQIDMLATNIAFSALFLIGSRTCGHIVTRKESEGTMLLWRYIGNVLGIEPELLPVSEQEALRVLYTVLGYSNDGIDEDSLELAEALRDLPITAAGNDPVALKKAKREVLKHTAWTRLYAGKKTCDELNLPKVGLYILTPILFPMKNLPAEILRFFIPGLNKRLTKKGELWQRDRVNEGKEVLVSMVGDLRAKQMNYDAVDKLAERASRSDEKAA